MHLLLLPLPSGDRRVRHRRFPFSCPLIALLSLGGSALAQDSAGQPKPPADSVEPSSETPPSAPPSGGEEREDGETEQVPTEETRQPEPSGEAEPTGEPVKPSEEPAAAPSEPAAAEPEKAAETTAPESEATPVKPEPETVPPPAAAPKPAAEALPGSEPARSPIVTTSTPSAGTEPEVPRALVNAELGFAASSLDGSTGFWISPLLSGWFRVEKTIAVSAEWGSVALLASPDPDNDRSGVGAGNPYLGFYSIRQHGPTILRIGVGMTIPVATISADSRLADWDTYHGAMAMRGMWRWWLWVPDSISLALPVSWDSTIGDGWLWGGEAALATTVILPKPARSTVFLRGEPRTADLLIPMELYGGYRRGDLDLGLKLQAVFVATGETELQLSLSPFGKLRIGQGFLETRFTANLDRPLGFAFEKGRFWGLHLGGGYGFQ